MIVTAISNVTLATWNGDPYAKIHRTSASAP